MPEFLNGPDAIVKILSAGLFGFAVIIFLSSVYLVYRLINLRGDSPASAQIGWKTAAAISVLIAAVIVCGGALYFSLSDPVRVIHITVEKYPFQRKQFADITLGMNPKPVSFLDSTIVEVKNNDRLTIHLAEIDDFIDDLEDTIARYRRANSGLVTANSVLEQEWVPPPPINLDTGGQVVP